MGEGRAACPQGLLRLLLMARWLLARETLEFEFDVYRNLLKQVDVQSKLGEPMQRVITGARVGAELQEDSWSPSVVLGLCT